MCLYLKSLEIQGFKSFPEKTILSFDKPITAIVGPNGSGKSNIADAILWVMGEQSSRTLRGGKMEDVIFGGTIRRPQVGFAEVSLILDNSDRVLDLDYQEVMITRRYYRSGESEYFINRQLVRLRDLSELFMDTGLGREGYSVIGQGRIDAILSAKSTDRREIFEEAAGISRFRHRKEEAERKLTHTEENLLRLGDKISELELQVEPLREQSETARKYLLLRDELRQLEISVWTDTLERLNEQREINERDHAAAEAQKDAVGQEIGLLYERAETFSQRMREKERELEELRGAVAAQEGRAAETESAIAVFKARLEDNAGEADRIRRELDDQAGRDGGIKTQIDTRRGRISDIAAEKEQLAASAASLGEELRQLTGTADESSRRLGALMARESELLASAGEGKSALSALASAAQEMYDREGAAAQETAAAAGRHEGTRAERAACAEALEQAGQELSSLKNVIDGYTLRLEGRKKKAEAAADKKMKQSMALGALRSRIALLTDMEKDYRGYSKAVKLVMQEARRGILKNIDGTVGSLVETDGRFAVAIETALGGALQNIVVAAEEDGKEAINYLKRHDGGRATFLPLTAVRGSVLDTRGLSGETGFEGLAIDLARFDKKFAGVYASLLGRVVVADNLDNAVRIARRHKNSFRIVTLDGQVINAGGSMTGGSAATGSGILSRANELRELTAQEGRLTEDDARAGRDHAEALRELDAARYELETAGAQRRAVEDRVIKLEADLSHFDALLKASAENLEALRAESAALARRIETNTRDTQIARETIAACEGELDEVRERIARDTQGREALTAERERLNAGLAELRARDASLVAEEEALQKAVSELSELRSLLTGDRLQQQRHMEELAAARDGLLADIAAKEAALAGTADATARLRARMEQAAAARLELEGERSRRDREMQEKNNTLLQLERECARLEQKKLAAEMEEKQIVDRLWDTYEISRTAAMAVRGAVKNDAEARRRITRLKGEISGLGNPNIGAIDEFERVNGRYTYLTGQRDDVETAKNELMGIIRDITSEMRTLFARGFEQIRESFKETFLEFFGGGQASLELDDPEDILASGIEIKVQPPGKSLKTITLLSGGEKAFVAIALYFAILKIRPTPFVVMDEIEAALDESNVLRFAFNMRKMSQKTQMVVITHHRGTMEEADVLYGVTMPEQGVSRVLCIDLEEAERALKKRA